MRMNRALLSIGGVAYALFHATLGLLWASEYQNSAAAYLSIGIYVVLALATMLLYRGMKIPLIQAVITVAGLLVIPPLSQSQLDLQHLTDYSTWYVMGIGTVLSAVALRRHVILAIVSMCAAIIEIMVWAGWQNFFASGLLGAIMLLAGTAVVTIGLRRAEAETSAFAEQNERSVAEAAAVLAAGEQRSKMMLETLTRS